MNSEDMQQALLALAFEMTASMETANVCISDMDLKNSTELFDIAQYLEYLIRKEQEES